MAENITTANAKYARDIGFDFAHSTDAVQAELFTGFFQGLPIACGAGHHAETQMGYMLDKLDTKTLAALEELGRYAQLVRETKS